MDETEILERPIEIRGEMSEDLDLFFDVQQMRDVFDLKQENYSVLCQLVMEYFLEVGDPVELESYITRTRFFDYLTEEPKPRDILYFVCLLNDNLREHERKAFFGKRDAFHRLFN
jgi:hypothetical protein